MPISSKSGKFLFRGGQYNENNPLRIAIKGQEILQNRQRIVKEKWKSRDGNNQSASTGGPIGGGVTAAILTLTLPTPPSLSLSLCLSVSLPRPPSHFSPLAPFSTTDCQFSTNFLILLLFISFPFVLSLLFQTVLTAPMLLFRILRDSLTPLPLPSRSLSPTTIYHIFTDSSSILSIAFVILI